MFALHLGDTVYYTAVTGHMHEAFGRWWFNFNLAKKKLYYLKQINKGFFWLSSMHVLSTNTTVSCLGIYQNCYKAFFKMHDQEWKSTPKRYFPHLPSEPLFLCFSTVCFSRKHFSNFWTLRTQAWIYPKSIHSWMALMRKKKKTKLTWFVHS